VGGNTSCVEVRCGGKLLIFDGGTGLRALGAELEKRAVSAHLFFTHYHWDHMQGFPFFVPAYRAGNELALYGPDFGATSSLPYAEGEVERREPSAGGRSAVENALREQMRGPHFPVGLEAMRARMRFVGVAPGERIQLGGVTVRSATLCHPNGCLAYRVDAGGRSVVIATDCEHPAGEEQTAPEGAQPGVDENLLALARGADVLIYDAQYTDEEYETHRGWGHSTGRAGAALAKRAGVERLILTHHDPSHDDWRVAQIEAEVRGHFAHTDAAREGLRLILQERGEVMEAQGETVA
jgi:phosphoribosyl 1,2-cyclic phosphodiesterase